MPTTPAAASSPTASLRYEWTELLIAFSLGRKSCGYRIERRRPHLTCRFAAVQCIISSCYISFPDDEMNLHDLETFVSIARLGGVTRAAGQLHRSQPAF